LCWTGNSDPADKPQGFWKAKNAKGFGVYVDMDSLWQLVAVSHYKNAARLAMERNGFVGRLWTKGFSVRYCFDENQLNNVIQYVNRHNRKSPSKSPTACPP